MRVDSRLRVSRPGLTAVIGLGVTGGLLLVAQSALLSRIVNNVFLQHDVEVAGLLLALLGVGGLRALVVWGSETGAAYVAETVKTNLRQRLYGRILALGPAYTRGERSGELLATLVEGVDSLDSYLREYLPALAMAGLVPLVMLIFVFPTDAFSGLVLLVTAPLIPMFMVLIGKAAGALSRRQWQSLSRMSAHFLDVLQGLPTLKLFGRSRAQIEIIARISDEFRQSTMDVLRVAFLSALVLEMVATISVAIIAVEIGLRLLYGQFDFERAFFILVIAPAFYAPLRTLGARFHSGTAGTAALERIAEVLESEPASPASRPDRNLQFRFHIVLSDVHYTYEDGRPALKGLSLELRPGERVALVGASGAGKTTVSHLLLRFIAPRQGEIIVDGTHLEEIPADTWRQQIAWVPQRPFLFNMGVADNIRLGRPDASLADVMRAARMAYAHNFVTALPQGYDTPIGERGMRLSGGQAQRLALARAFLRDAPFILLDEATASLDAESEAIIRQAIAQLLNDRTALVIAHRLHTVYDFDRILVMDGGQVVESGTHRSLLQRDGIYRQLVMAYEGDA